MPESTLGIYLNDHLGLIAGEIELARRAAGENDTTPLGPFLSVYAEQVAGQQALVEMILNNLGGQPSSLKQAAGWLAEKIGRLKPNDAWTGYTDLARVLELEGLISAATARSSLWQALSDLPAAMLQDAASHLPQAQETTAQHLASLREHHQQAVQAAFK